MTTTRKKRKRGRSPVRRALLIIFLIGTTTFIAALAFGMVAVASVAISLPKLADVKPREISLTSKMYDGGGHLLTELHAEEDREWAELGQIPPQMQWSVIAIEDNRFYEHKGIDYQSIGRALFRDIAVGGVVEGGSTITQQYVKKVYLTDERTFMRKVREATLSWEIEKTLSKKQILERYLNTIYFGSGSYGVKAASRNYFGKPLHKLTLAESAMLAGLIKSPDGTSPRRSMKLAKARQVVVLNRMAQLKLISDKQAQSAANEKIKIVPKIKESKTMGYFVQYVRSYLLENYGVDRVFGGGLRVYTTINPRMQAAAERAVDSTLNQYGDPSASLVSISPRSCEIKAMVGGRDFTKNKFNLAVQSRRQTGSSFKIFVLAAALKEKKSIYDTYTSAPQTIHIPGSTVPWKVSNSGSYRGSITIEQATVWSDNTVYAQMMMDVGARDVVKTAHAMGITSELEPVPAIALGGLTNGVSPLEMTNAITTLAANGQRCEPIFIRKITDARGNVLEDFKTTKVKALNPALAKLENRVLSKVIAGGTGKRAAIGRPAAGKTGTAQNYRDAWFVGYTPDLATSVWMGYPGSQISMRNVHGIRVMGGTFPAEIWAKFMREALKFTPPTPFETPTQKALANAGQTKFGPPKKAADSKAEGTTADAAGKTKKAKSRRR